MDLPEPPLSLISYENKQTQSVNLSGTLLLTGISFSLTSFLIPSLLLPKFIFLCNLP